MMSRFPCFKFKFADRDPGRPTVGQAGSASACDRLAVPVSRCVTVAGGGFEIMIIMPGIVGRKFKFAGGPGRGLEVRRRRRAR